MTSTRLLTSCAVVACLLTAAAPATAEDSGGVPVQTFDETGGGIVASPSPGPATTDPADAPVAEAAQDETPTTPEGEEQPPDEEDGGTGTTPDEEIIAPAPEGGGGDTAGESGASFLPRTGLELAALTAIGLGLLLAGGALWPTSSWPPPRRARLSRSLPRR